MNISSYQLAKIQIILSGILFSLLGFLGIKIFDSGLDIKLMLFWRFIISALFLIFYYRTIPNFRQAYKAFLLGVLLYSSSTYLWFFSIKTISTGLAMVIFYSFPIYVAILSIIINKEKFDFIKSLSFIMMIIGLILISNIENIHVDYLGLIFCILSAIIYGIYFFLSKKLNKDVDSSQSAIMVSLGNSLVFFILSIDLFNFNFNFGISLCFNLLLISILSTALPILLLFRSIKFTSEIEASILSVLEPVFSVIIGIYLLGEKINFVQIMGIIFIILSSISIQFKKRDN